ncbi:MAG: hypothetical protein ACLGIM_00265 [Alphaproteobacteria bacterium]
MTQPNPEHDYDDKGQVAVMGHLLIRDRSTGEILVRKSTQTDFRKQTATTDEFSDPAQR